MIQSNTSAAPLQEEERRPDLTVVVVSWNVGEMLGRCLEALFSPNVQGKLQVEVIVVDNASRDASAQVARSFPGVRLIEMRANLGYGRASNVGLRAARGKHLLVLNPDTIPQSGCLETLVCFANGHPHTGIVAPRLLNADGTTQQAAFRFPTLAMAALDLFPLPGVVPGRVRARIAHSWLNGRYQQEEVASKPFKIDHPLGACMLLNRAAYKALRGFNEELFMYAEEIDLAIRYARAGWQCWQVPAAQVIHIGGQSTRQAPDRMFVELWRSRLYIYKRYYSLPARLAHSALLTAAQLRDLAAARLATRRARIPPIEANRRNRRARAVLRLVFHR